MHAIVCSGKASKLKLQYLPNEGGTVGTLLVDMMTNSTVAATS